MKKQILITFLALVTSFSAFAERETSQLQYLETQSCATADLQKTIVATADRVMKEAEKVTVLESALGLTKAQKEAGITASIKGSFPRSSVAQHAKNIKKAEARAQAGQVGVTAPAKFDVVFEVQDAALANKVVKRGRAMLEVACRVETKSSGDQKVLRHAAQLISFDIQAKNK